MHELNDHAYTQRSWQQCRVEQAHISPNYKLNSTELAQYNCATEVLAAHHNKYNMDKVKNTNKTKKVYQRWNSMEKYTVMLAIAQSGNRDVGNIVNVLENRTENQVSLVLSNIHYTNLYKYILYILHCTYTHI